MKHSKTKQVFGAQKIAKRNFSGKLAPILLLLLLVMLTVLPIAFAKIDFNSSISKEDEKQFDAILAPVMKIYNFIKYAASVAGVLMLVFAGITFVTAGSELGKKEKAKNMAVGVVIGLILIWIAPLIVQYIF